LQERYRGVRVIGEGGFGRTFLGLLTGYFQKDDGDDLIFDSMRMQWIWKQYVSVSQELEIVLDKMLQDIPVDRFQSATEVFLALQIQEVPANIIVPQLPVSPNPFQQVLQFISPPLKPPVYPNQNENLGKGVILEMVAIPGGKFLMGSPEGEGNDREKPQHQVTIQPFYMGKYPVTQAQWEMVSRLPEVKIDLRSKPSHFKGANLPVENVSWHDAREFCARLSKATGKLYRLPSEAEWEYACRANTTTPYYFGNTITTDLVNHNNKYGQTTDVGKFPPNAFGLYDMHGNVWEWCEDSWHKNYMTAPNNGNALTSQSDNKRMLRGGQWYLNPSYCRSASRSYNNGDRRNKDNSFRLVVSGAGTL
jgi:formylglycine-generating enzyme required for sulfatase activity